MHRRVDTISFSAATDVLHWTFSVDFRIPVGFPTFDPSAEHFARSGKDPSLQDSTYYVPIALLRKWEPFWTFDLRDEEGRALHLLTGTKNREIDACALQSLAPAEARAEELRKLRDLAIADSLEAQQLFRELGASVQRRWDGLSADEDEAWRRTLGVAGALTTNTLLWVCLRGRPRDRRIIKAAFEEPISGALLPRRQILSAVGWGPLRFHLPVPNFGQRDSYHLQVVPPEGMEVHDLKLGIRDRDVAPPVASGRPRTSLDRMAWNAALGLHQIRHSVRARIDGLRGLLPAEPLRADQPFAEPKPVRPWVSDTPERGHVYLGKSHDQYGLVQLDLAVPNSWLATSALGMAVATAALMTTASLLVATVGIPKDDVEPWVAVLLLVPALLAYVLVRPNEHPLAKRLLKTVRSLTLFAGAQPILGAITLLGYVRDPEGVLPFWAGYAVLGWLTVVALLLSWLLPYTKAGVPDSPYAPRVSRGITIVEDYGERRG